MPYHQWFKLYPIQYRSTIICLCLSKDGMKVIPLEGLLMAIHTIFGMSYIPLFSRQID